MRNIKLNLEYDGTNYAGWQVQNKKYRTIQQALEKALRRILGKKIRVISSGRTDSGVHAFGQVANFKTDSTIEVRKLQRALNAVLPDDIAVTKTEEVGKSFHSRFSAKSKVYRYTILNRPSRPALLRSVAYFCPYPLNLRMMAKDARVLLGRHNFKSFQAADKKERGAVRQIKSLKVSRDGDLIYIDIEADGFLYNMVRNIVGTLIDVGRGRLPEGSIKKILLAENRRFAGPTVPAKGLCLLEVRY